MRLPLPSLFALVTAATAGCLPPPVHHGTYAEDGELTEFSASVEDLRALCEDGHDASCEILRDRGKDVPARRKQPDGDELIGLGTCFAISPDGLIATAQHVIDGATQIEVQFGEDKPIAATVVKASSAVDAAVLKIDRSATDWLAVNPTASSKLGDQVFTIGFPQPGALGFAPKFSEGAISAVTGLGEEHLLQVSVPVHQGNSGGALVTTRGELLGIVIARVDDKVFYERTGAIAGDISFASKVGFLAPLVDPAHHAKPEAVDRAAAIARVERSTCKVFVAKRAKR